MSKRKTQPYSRGSAIAWIMIWLAGMAGVGWSMLNIAIPRVERKIQIGVLDEIARVDQANISVAVKGQQAILQGQLASADVRHAVLTAAANAPGVRSVRDELTVVESAATETIELAQNDSAAEKSEAEPHPSLQNKVERTSELLSDSEQDRDLPDDTADDELISDELPAEPSLNDDEDQLAADLNLPAATLDDESDKVDVTATADSPTEKQDAGAIAADEPANLELPSLTLKVTADILSVEGAMSDADDADALIQDALTSFELDVVSNGLSISEDIAPALWLDSIQRVIPLMNSMTDPRLEIRERQITLSGLAPNRQVHDAIISEALMSLGEYSLVERIKVVEDTEGTNTATTMIVASATSTVLEQPVTPDQTVAIADIQASSENPETAEPGQADEAAEETSNESIPSREIVNQPTPDVSTETTDEPSVEANNSEENQQTIQVAQSGETDNESVSGETSGAGENAKSDESSEMPSEEPEESAPTDVESADAGLANEDSGATDAVEPTQASELTEIDTAMLQAESEPEPEPQPESDNASGSEPAEPEQSVEAIEAVSAPESNPVEIETTAAEPEQVATDRPVETDENADTTDSDTAGIDTAMSEAEAELKPEADTDTDTDTDTELDPKPTSSDQPGEAAASVDSPDTKPTDMEPSEAAESETSSDLPTADATVSATESGQGSNDRSNTDSVERAQAESLSVEAETTHSENTEQAESNGDVGDELEAALAQLPTLRILFDSDLPVLTEESMDVLDQIAEVLIRFPDTKVAIEGHTDSAGDSQNNLELSLLRATTVRDYLIDRGVSVFNLRALGYGEEVPIADNRTAEGRAINRRIDFTF